MGMTVIESATSSAPCGCPKCRGNSWKIHRAWIEAQWSQADAVDVPREAKEREKRIAESWHRYERLQERARVAMPDRVAILTGAADPSVGALRSVLAWNERTDEYTGFDPESERNLVVLAGPKGTGKTLAAVWLALHREATEEPAFITAHAIARMARIDERRDELYGASLVIVDDLGAERTDAKQMAAEVDELVDAFYQRYALLIITTNLAASRFRRRYGGRVVDRLAERGVWIQCTGPSLRGARDAGATEG